MKQTLFLLISLFILNSSTAQEFNQKIDKDSLFQVVIKNAHSSKVEELTKVFNEGNNQEKEFLLMILSMNPLYWSMASSNSELIPFVSLTH